MMKPIKSISIKQYLKAHEAFVLNALEESKNLESLEREHLKQIGFMQHERLVHLMVLCLTTIVFFSGVILILSYESILLYFLVVIIGILEMFYLVHYFRLENTIQRWYTLDQKIQLKKER